MSVRAWGDLKSSEFAGLDPESTIVILPLAAIEQHGPHLPVSVDTTIMEGMLAALSAAKPPESVLVLPVQAVAKSDEHIRAPGTLTYSATTALAAWADIGAGVARAGLRKLVIVSSHGGNRDLMGVLARDLRIRHSMLAVTTSWRFFGVPEGLFGKLDVTHGIHAGEIETSLMLHLAPGLVDMAAAGRFEPVAARMDGEYAYLRPTGPHAFGWIAGDLHPSGAAGDASLASAEKGRLTIEHQIAGFLELLADVARFPLSGLQKPA